MKLGTVDKVKDIKLNVLQMLASINLMSMISEVVGEVVSEYLCVLKTTTCFCQNYTFLEKLLLS